MDTPNYSNMTMGEVFKTLETLKIDTTSATASDIASALKIDMKLAASIVESLKIDNKSKAYEFFDMVKEKVDKSDDNGALFYLNKAIELAPNEGLFYRERGYLKFLLKDKPGADMDLKKAKALGDKDPNLDKVIEKYQIVTIQNKKDGCYTYNIRFANMAGVSAPLKVCAFNLSLWSGDSDEQ